MATTVVGWSDEVDEVLAGDLVAGAAYLTPAGGAVVTGVAPCGLRDRDRGRGSFTTSLGFATKLERIIANPRVALAYHAREHGFSASPRFVLVQGIATVELVPSRQRLDSLVPEAERFLGEVRRGVLWDRLLREYYAERVFVDVTVTRVVDWPDPGAFGAPRVSGQPAPAPPAGQPAPRSGTGPRVPVDRLAQQAAVLPHRLLAYRGGDGFPVVLPVTFAHHDPAGLRLVLAPGLLPAGGRRAGLLAHSYRPRLVGLSSRTCTGWLEVGSDGAARYAPHSSKGFLAPPLKTPLLVSNGLLAKYGMWRAARSGVAARLRHLQAAPARADMVVTGPGDQPV